MTLNALLNHMLGEEKLFVADVGATGGPETRWKKWMGYCHFYTFDPDPRAQSWDSASTNFPVGLWSEPCIKTLNLMKFPQASSLFEINHRALDSFLNAWCHIQVGKENIALDTLDRLLGNNPLDFLKIDAEGAELEILKGGKDLIRDKCLGLQLEVSFCEKHKNAPFFSELDPVLREQGFQLFQLQREQWIRKNNLFCLESSPQLIWGNALYLLSKETFLQRLKVSSNREAFFAKYALILLTYHLYDYLYELCEEASMEPLKTALEQLIKIDRRKVFSLFLSLAFGYGKYLLAFSKNGKKRRSNYLKRRIRQVGYACQRLGRSAFAVYDEE